jgi:hypothetical protein
MKKGLLVLLVSMISVSSFAQGLRINTYGSYAFKDRVDFYADNNDYYSGILKDGFMYGGGLEVMADDDYGIELSYIRMSSYANMTYYNGGKKTTNYSLGTNYILLGSNRYFDTKNKMIEPFGGAQAGVVIFNYKNPTTLATGNITKFAWGLKSGVNIWATDNIGIKFQASVLSAVQSIGGGLYFGTGGSGAAINTNSSVFQFGLGGGITIKLGKDK